MKFHIALRNLFKIKFIRNFVWWDETMSGEKGSWAGMCRFESYWRYNCWFFFQIKSIQATITTTNWKHNFFLVAPLMLKQPPIPKKPYMWVTMLVVAFSHQTLKILVITIIKYKFKNTSLPKELS